MNPQNLDKLIKTFLKFLNIAILILFFMILILWYSDNKKNFFPQRKIKEIPNPVNPFK